MNTEIFSFILFFSISKPKIPGLTVQMLSEGHSLIFRLFCVAFNAMHRHRRISIGSYIAELNVCGILMLIDHVTYQHQKK